MIASRTVHGRVCLAFTDRWGGASTAPFDQLNLACHVGDDPAAVEKNRELLAERIGFPAERVVYMNQVHGSSVALVDGPWEAGSGPRAVDAMVTATPGLALAVLVADCVPVVLADPEAGVIGVAHAGRPGLAAGVVPAVVAAMREAGARQLVARIGPAVCGACYEVPDEMRAEVAAAVPQAWSTTRGGTPSLDVPGGVLAQLREYGVQADPGIACAIECTLESHSFYSYRRNRTTGRFAGLAWMSN